MGKAQMQDRRHKIFLRVIQQRRVHVLSARSALGAFPDNINLCGMCEFNQDPGRYLYQQKDKSPDELAALSFITGKRPHHWMHLVCAYSFHNGCMEGKQVQDRQRLNAVAMS